jgi:hypothetical protein
MAIFSSIAAGYAGSYNSSLLVFDFSQNKSTYTWDNSYKKSFDFSRLTCNLQLNTNSTLLKKPGKRWQEHLWTTFDAEYRIAEGFALVPIINHSRNALQNRIVYTSELKLSVPFSRINFLEFTPFVANKAVKRVGEPPAGVDKGTGWGITAASRRLVFLNNNLQSSIKYEYYDLSRIPYSEFSARLGSMMAWSLADTLTWGLKNDESTTRYFSSARQTGDANDIIRQVKVDRAAEYYARVTLPAEFVARTRGDVNYIRYYYSPGAEAISVSQYDNYSQNRNYNIELEKQLLKRIKLQAGYRYGWGEEDFRGSVLDQWFELGEISFKASTEITLKDSAVFDGIIGVTSYYGLYKVSAGERDLKTQIYNFRYRHIFSRYFNGEIRAGYNNFHQIYTNALSSANNSQNETYLLRSTSDWQVTPAISVQQSFEIRANYIIYDYVPNPIETPSRIFRRGSSETLFGFKISDRFSLKPGYTYRYEDYGKLIWEEENWQMATGWDRRYHNISFKASYYPFRKICIEPECSWESKKEYNHVLEKAEGNIENEMVARELRLDDFKTIAALTLTWNFSESEYLIAGYSRRKWEIGGEEYDVSNFVNISVRYTF